MMTNRSLARVLGTCLVATAVGTAAGRPCAAAPENEAVLREASRHFQQGVTFYAEADYRGALTDFKRAAALAPNATVLYNIGQTQFQLRDYAAALKTFERYLSLADGDGHRSEVEGTMRLLGTRVARLSVISVPPGAEISVDGEVIGRA